MTGVWYSCEKQFEADAKFSVSIIIPCLNEEGNVQKLYQKLTNTLHCYFDYEMIFIDDGSSDTTLDKISFLAGQDQKVKYLSFSKNFGHQNAIKAGLDHARGDCVISMDADLQHPPELISKLVDKWLEGYEIVYTTRDDSRGGNFLKKTTSSIFYRFINIVANLKLDQGVADFRLLDRSVVDVLGRINESVLFYRGLVGWIGFKQCSIPYVPSQRHCGVTKYSLRKMFAFAMAGVTSFSVKPLHLATVAGFTLSVFSTLYALYAIYVYIFTHRAIPGWASVLVSVLFIGGFQLIILGIIGEYIGKMFIEVKRRPHYILRRTNIGSAYLSRGSND